MLSLFFQGLPGVPGPNGLSGPKVVCLINYTILFFASCFYLVFLNAPTSFCFVPAQGDVGQGGFPGTMGPAGKEVSTRSKYKPALDFCHLRCVTALFDCDTSGRARWARRARACWTDRRTCKYLSCLNFCCAHFVQMFIFWNVLLFCCSQGAVGGQGPIGSAGKPGARVSKEHKDRSAQLDSNSLILI